MSVSAVMVVGGLSGKCVSVSRCCIVCVSDCGGGDKLGHIGLFCSFFFFKWVLSQIWSCSGLTSDLMLSEHSCLCVQGALLAGTGDHMEYLRLHLVGLMQGQRPPHCVFTPTAQLHLFESALTKCQRPQWETPWYPGPPWP